MIRYLEKRHIKHSFGFIFQYVNWYKYLENNPKNNQNFYIKWFIKHKSNNNKWKYQKNKGGGLLRFYGIHMIKVIYDLNFLFIKKNELNNDYWKGEFRDKKNNIIQVEIKFDTKDKFIFEKNNNIKIVSSNPFLEKITRKKGDPRCKYLKKHINDNLIKYKNIYNSNVKFINLWKKIEHENK